MTRGEVLVFKASCFPPLFFSFPPFMLQRSAFHSVSGPCSLPCTFSLLPGLLHSTKCFAYVRHGNGASDDKVLTFPFSTASATFPAGSEAGALCPFSCVKVARRSGLPRLMTLLMSLLLGVIADVSPDVVTLSNSS